MYGTTTSQTMTGKLTRFIPGGNHAHLVFDVLEPDGTPTLDKNGKPLQGESKRRRRRHSRDRVSR